MLIATALHISGTQVTVSSDSETEPSPQIRRRNTEGI